jgi:hypothetical protein
MFIGDKAAYECQECYAIVTDRTGHDKFHRTLLDCFEEIAKGLKALGKTIKLKIR